MSSIALDRESVLAAVAASLLLRGLFFGVCRRYVQRVLVSDLQQVAAEDVLSPNQPESRSASHELAEIPSYSRPSFGSRPKRSEHGSDTDTPESNRERGSKVSGVDAGTSWANLLATTTFCWTFAESCTLCTLVLVANGVSEK